MQPGVIALIFWVLAAFAAWGVVRSLRTGRVTETFTYHRDRNPGAFYLVLLGRVAIIGLAIAATLHALGLIGDPFTAIRSITPFQTQTPSSSPS